jgi:hypothetical protein
MCNSAIITGGRANPPIHKEFVVEGHLMTYWRAQQMQLKLKLMPINDSALILMHLISQEVKLTALRVV